MKENVLMKNYTTFKIGGPAKYFFVAKTEEDLINALKIAKKLKLPVFILGGGSNILISEKGFNGLVIKIGISTIKIKGKKAFVGAGANATRLAYMLADAGLSGLEWAVGVPATVGGLIYGSAQAFGTKISDAIENVKAINLKTLELETFSKEQCQFSLKNSIFKKNNLSGQENLIIISAVLKFKKKPIEEIKKQIKEFLDYRKNRHPNFPSAGSVFVNPVRNQLPKTTGDWLANLISNGVNPEKVEVIPAGYLISKIGLAGKKVGGAQISEKHANFIVNSGNATSKDVLTLMKLIKKQVKKVFGIELETEIQLVGFKK